LSRRTGLPPYERAVLLELAPLLEKFGVANDAQDHGSGAEARELRRSARARIAELLQQHAFLERLIPALRWELEHGNIEDVTWWRLQDDVDAWLAVTGALPDDGGRS
jgi:hypothetical protein